MPAIPSEVRNFLINMGNDPRYRGVADISEIGDYDPTIFRSRDYGKAAALYELSERDAHTRAVLDKRRNAVTSTPIVIRPGSDGALEQRSAEVIQEWVQNFGFNALCDWLLTATNYGISCAELIWGRNADGIQLPVTWRAIDPYRIRVRTDGRVAILTRQSPQRGTTLPAHRLICHRYNSGNGAFPYGKPLGSVLFWKIALKKVIEKYWGQAAERTGGPIVVLKAGPGGEVKELQKILQDMRSNRGLALPNQTEHGVVGGDNESRGDVFKNFIREVDESITRLVLGETLTTSINTQASRAAATVHDGIRKEVVRRDSDALNSDLNKQLMEAIYAFNWRGARRARFVRDFTVPESKLAQLQEMQALRNLGKKPVDENAVLTGILGFEVEDGEEPQPQPGQQGSFSFQAQNRARELLREARQNVLSLERVADELAATSVSGSDGAQFARDALDVLTSAENPEAAFAALESLIGRTRGDSWVEDFARALLVGDLGGQTPTE